MEPILVAVTLALKWGLSRDIAIAWIVTFPAAAAIGAVCALAARAIFAG
jgi:PiT family inorganic phosphate transporter